MALAPYTTNDEVRATCGVSAEDVSDDTLNLEVYARALYYEFNQLAANLRTDFLVVEAVATNARTVSQQALYDAVRLFSPYAVGNNLVGTLALAAPKSITDGKAAISRFAEPPFAELTKRLQAGYEKFRDNLEQAYGDYTGSSATAFALPSFMAVSSPRVDRVTGS